MKTFTFLIKRKRGTSLLALEGHRGDSKLDSEVHGGGKSQQDGTGHGLVTEEVIKYVD